MLKKEQVKIRLDALENVMKNDNEGNPKTDSICPDFL